MKAKTTIELRSEVIDVIGTAASDLHVTIKVMEASETQRTKMNTLANINIMVTHKYLDADGNKQVFKQSNAFENKTIKYTKTNNNKYDTLGFVQAVSFESYKTKGKDVPKDDRVWIPMSNIDATTLKLIGYYTEAQLQKWAADDAAKVATPVVVPEPVVIPAATDAELVKAQKALAKAEKELAKMKAAKEVNKKNKTA